VTCVQGCAEVWRSLTPGLETQLQLESAIDLFAHLLSLITQSQLSLSHPLVYVFAPTESMAAAIKAVNAKIRSNKVLDYFCSTREFTRRTTTIVHKS